MEIVASQITCYMSRSDIALSVGLFYQMNNSQQSVILTLRYIVPTSHLTTDAVISIDSLGC